MARGARVEVELDEVTYSALEKLATRLGVSASWLLAEVLRPVVQQLWYFLEHGDVTASCRDVVDPEALRGRRPARRVVEAAQVVAAARRAYGRVPREVGLSELKFRTVSSRETIARRVRILAELGVARLEGERLVFPSPELAERLLDCAVKLEVIHGFRLVRPELRG